MIKSEPKNLVKKPRILVIGGQGREHAIVWKLARSPLRPKIYCVPGNPGIRKYAECIKADITNLDNLCSIAKDKKIDMVIVGPELPLSLGIVDLFEKNNIKVFGPNKECAKLESSKQFAKRFMVEYDIPTARFMEFDNIDRAKDFIKTMSSKFVIKVDGLAAGKGVFICDNIEEGFEVLDRIFLDREFGNAGNSVIIEEYLEGIEVSFMVFTDGNAILPMTSSQDHKRVWDRDLGPNSGGMGAYSPMPLITEELETKILDEIMIPAINGIYEKTGTRYKGVLYAGLMLEGTNLKVLEFNVRFGDPEAQVILTRLETDLVEIMYACIDETLNTINIEWSDKSSVCVVATSGGYPFEYDTNMEIKGLGFLNNEDIEIFHAGTGMSGMKLVTTGGRVLGITAMGESLADAITNAYMAISYVDFEGIFYRDDIGLKGLGYEL